MEQLKSHSLIESKKDRGKVLSCLVLGRALDKAEEELEVIKNHIGFYSKYDDVYVNDVFIKLKEFPKLKTKTWMGSYRYDGGDYRGKYNIYTLDYFLVMIDSFKSEIMDKTGILSTGRF